MNVEEGIEAYITSQPDQKRADMQRLHRAIPDIKPGVNCGFWMVKMLKIKLCPILMWDMDFRL